LPYTTEERMEGDAEAAATEVHEAGQTLKRRYDELLSC